MTNSGDKKTSSMATAKIEVWLAGVLMLIAFFVGFLLHGVTSEPAAPTQLQPVTGLQGGIVPAGPLTSDQIQGQLPANHPEVAPGQTAPGAPDASPSTGGGNKDQGNGNNNNNNP